MSAPLKPGDKVRLSSPPYRTGTVLRLRARPRRRSPGMDVLPDDLMEDELEFKSAREEFRAGRFILRTISSLWELAEAPNRAKKGGRK